MTEGAAALDDSKAGNGGQWSKVNFSPDATDLCIAIIAQPRKDFVVGEGSTV